MITGSTDPAHTYNNSDDCACDSTVSIVLSCELLLLLLFVIFHDVNSPRVTLIPNVSYGLL